MASVIWTKPRVEWLGAPAFLGANSNWTPLEKEMIKRKGGTTEDDFKAYGTIAGSIGGAAACAAFGPVAAVGCAALGGILGGLIGGVVGKQIKIIAGKTDEEQMIAYWNKAVTDGSKAAKGILAVKAYLTMREYAMSLGYTDAELTKAGAPPAPIDSRWKPSAQRYEQAKKNYAFVQQKAAAGGQKPGDCAMGTKLGIVGPDKLTCTDFLYTTFWRGAWGPVAAPSEPIDYYAVGRDEATAGGTSGGGCDITFPTLQQGVQLDKNLKCITIRPSMSAKALIAKINALPKVKASKGIVETPVTTTGGGGGTSTGLVLGGLATAIALAWWLL